MANQRNPRVPDHLQAAFKAETPAIRKELKAIERERRGHQPDLDTLEARLKPMLERLAYWHSIFTTHNIPLRLRNVWHDLNMSARLSDEEIRYLRSRSTRRSEAR
jgi:hypothetical protein